MSTSPHGQGDAVAPRLYSARSFDDVAASRVTKVGRASRSLRCPLVRFCVAHLTVARPADRAPFDLFEPCGQRPAGRVGVACAELLERGLHRVAVSLLALSVASGVGEI